MNYMKLALALAGISLVAWLVIALRPTPTSNAVIAAVSDSPSVSVRCETTKGAISISVRPSWSPLGAQRFLQLVDDGFYTNLPLFRCMSGFVCQFGAKPGGSKYSAIQDDPRIPELRKFKPGFLSFAGYAPNSRANHVFIALAGVDSLGTQAWETPFGQIEEASMSIVAQFNTSYGEMAPTGKGPDVRKIEAPDGADYLKSNFPNLDYFLSCSRK